MAMSEIGTPGSVAPGIALWTATSSKAGAAKGVAEAGGRVSLETAGLGRAIEMSAGAASATGGAMDGVTSGSGAGGTGLTAPGFTTSGGGAMTPVHTATEGNWRTDRLSLISGTG
jgi:hypothetical protein